MKAITFFTSQYASSSLQWSYINSCDATDFIFIPSAYPTPNTAAAEMAIAIKTLIDGRGSKTTNVYIGTPGITSLNFGLNPSASTLTAFLTSVYGDSNISSHTYRSKIKGVYMNQESLYGDVDYNNLLNGTMSGNLQIKRMKDISDWVKAGNVGGTKFIWIPYYGYGEIAGIVIKNIGYVADSVQIFDDVMMQPSVFFHPETTNGNFNGIKCSMDINKVCYRDGVAVIANKVSTTQIGYEMEFSVYDSDAENKYAQYTTAFANYKSKPQSFYWSQYGDNNTFSKINDWY